VTTLRVEVPATILLGGGALGLALDRPLTLDARITSVGDPMEGDETAGAAYRAFPSEALPGACFTVTQNLPACLGDVTARSVAGLAAAAVAVEAKDAQKALFQSAALCVGDIVRAASAVYGGVMTAFRVGEAVYSTPIANHLALDVVLVIPSEPRHPSSTPFEHARLAYLVGSLIWGRWDQLKDALSAPQDLDPAIGSLVGAARAATPYGATVADGMVVAFTPRGDTGAVTAAVTARAANLTCEIQVIETTVRGAGVTVKNLDEAPAGA